MGHLQVRLDNVSVVTNFPLARISACSSASGLLDVLLSSAFAGTRLAVNTWVKSLLALGNPIWLSRCDRMEDR